MRKTVITTLLVLGLFGQALAAEPVKIGLAAMISPKETVKFYGQMLEYVGKKLGRPVEMIQRENYDEMDAMLEKGEVSIAFLCSGPYVKDKDKFSAELLVAPQSYGAPVYYAYILVPKDSPYKTWDDLRGKKFAFTDPKSNTGCIVPTYMIGKAFNQTPAQFFGEQNITYTKSHDKSIEAVGKKLVDGSSVDSLIYDYAAKKYPERTAGTRILVKSPPYGIPPVVVNPKFVDKATADKVKEIFLKMHEDPEGKAILSGIMVDKFIVPKDSDYNSVREMADWLSKMAK
jgi:phosphonate transport system substrate-binding protein